MISDQDGACDLPTTKGELEKSSLLASPLYTSTYFTCFQQNQWDQE